MRTIGTILLCIGVLTLILTLNMDTTVTTGFGRVHNIGLMDQRRTCLIVSIAAIVVGLGMAVAGKCLARYEEGNTREGEK